MTCRLALAALLSIVTCSLADQHLRRQPSAPSPASAAEDSDADSGGDSPADQANAYITQAVSTQIPCSCDCCEVQKLLPANFIKKPNGDEVTSSCFKSVTAESPEDNNGEEALCPNQCQINSDNSILTAARGPLDYDRFCNYDCQPVTDTAGTACVQFDGETYKEASNEDTGGNGQELYPTPVLGINSGYGDGPGVTPTQAAAPVEAASPEPAASEPEAVEEKKKPAKKVAKKKAQKKATPPPAEKLQIVYDMRKLIAERLRSEAGAAVASGAAAAERVRSNEWKAEQNSINLKKIRIKLGGMAGKVEEGVAGIEADKNIADEAERKTKENLASGRLFSSALAKETRKLADEAIKKAVTPCSELAAKDRAEAKGLDKPEDWVKVVAARAANPYQKAVTDAVQRTSEYKNFADGLMVQAYGAQKQANTLISHVNVLEAHGDLIGATIEKKQVTNLLGRAKALQAEAKGYWNTAQSTRETIPKWQMAAAQAAAYAAWEYSNNAKAFR